MRIIGTFLRWSLIGSLILLFGYLFISTLSASPLAGLAGAISKISAVVAGAPGRFISGASLPQPAVTDIAPPAAQVSHGIAPRTCIGIGAEPGGENKSEWPWGLALDNPCPDGWAVYGVDNPGGSRYWSADRLQVGASCCPLPAPDILTAEHTFAAELCPEDFVATSGTPTHTSNPTGPLPVRCTKINTARFQLGETRAGTYWGTGFTYWQNTIRILHDELPPAVRLGIGRLGKYWWSVQGCIGYPPGGLFSGRLGKRCSQVAFRQLQFRGAPGDPARGTPVKMFPDCKYPPYEFEPGGTCSRDQHAGGADLP